MLRRCLLSLSILSITVQLSAALVIDGQGASGRSGGNGYGGGNGADGADGTDGKAVELFLSEAGAQVVARGTVGDVAYEGQVSHYGDWFVVRTDGGDGGSGGSGGNGSRGRDGADGYRGRDGARGWQGRPGRNGTRQRPNGENGWRGQNGENGTDGTDGEDGTDGGDGGNGGRGGAGGSGQPIRIYYQDSALLMHVFASFRGGKAGAGGAAGSGGYRGSGGDGGRGGSGGLGGWGGRGGRGYRCSAREKERGCRNGRDGRRGPSGWSGQRGRDGNDGRDGVSGNSGFAGMRGRDGSEGSIAYIEVDDEGRPIRTHSKIYELVPVSYQLVDGNNDGIFEPGEEVTIRNLVIRNRGQLTMPAGAELMLSTSQSAASKQTIPLPAIAAGDSFAFEEDFSLLVNQDSVIGSSLQVQTHLSFRGIRFQQSLDKKVTIQRPLIIRGVTVADTVTFAKEYQLQVTIENISQKDYATGVLDFTWPSGIVADMDTPLGVVPSGQSKTEVWSFKIHDDLSAYDQLPMAIRLYREETLYVSVDKTLIVAPAYRFRSDADGLLLYDGKSQQTYEAIRQALLDLGLKLDLYDVHLEGQITEDVTLNYRGKVIAYPQRYKANGRTQTLVNQFLQDKGGVFSTGSLALSANNYKHVWFRVQDKDFYALSAHEQREIVTQGLIKAFTIEQKLDFIRQQVESRRTDLLQLAKSALLKDMTREYKVAREDKEVLKRNPMIKSYSEYTQSLGIRSPAWEYLVKLVPDLKEIGRFGSTRYRFRKLYEPIIDYYEEYYD